MEEGGRRWKGSNSLIWYRHEKVDLQCDLEHDCKKVEEVNGSTWHYFSSPVAQQACKKVAEVDNS